MRQEHVTLKNVEVERLFELIKKHLQEIKLDIIHEETESPTASTASGYWNLKAHKGSKGSIVVGNIRDVEVMISGTKGNYDLVLRTGAWGKDSNCTNSHSHSRDSRTRYDSGCSG